MKNRMKLWTLFAALILLIPAHTLTAQKRTKAEVIRDLDRLYTHLLQNDMFNGGVGVRYEGDIIYSKGFGTANFDKGTPFTPASQTEIASVSKQFTAAAIMMLWNEGKLQLSDDVNLYFNPALPYNGITIAHLLTHQSGVPEYSTLMRDHWDHAKVATNNDIIELVRARKPPVLFAPGASYQYSNLGYLLLAEIVHQVAGKPLDVFLSERVFIPFGMSSTGFFPRTAISKMPLYAPGVIKNNAGRYVLPETTKSRAYVWYLSGRFGPGRLTSSVNDLFVWDSLLYTNAVLPQPVLQEMYLPRATVNEQKISYGYGWRITEDPYVIYHTGSWPGNLTYIKRFMKQHSTVIILNNTSSPYMEAIREATDAIVSGKEWTLPKKNNGK